MLRKPRTSGGDMQLARFDGKRWVLFGEVIGHE
jgi:hypothetical protein